MVLRAGIFSKIHYLLPGLIVLTMAIQLECRELPSGTRSGRSRPFATLWWLGLQFEVDQRAGVQTGFWLEPLNGFVLSREH